jgi:hypothetical protein
MLQCRNLRDHTMATGSGFGTFTYATNSAPTRVRAAVERTRRLRRERGYTDVYPRAAVAATRSVCVYARERGYMCGASATSAFCAVSE